MGGSASPHAAIPGLAANVHWLRDNIPNSRGERYTWVQIAEQMTELGYPISFAAVTMISNGRTTAPSARTLYFLSRVFGVPMEFFLDEEINRRVREQILSL